MSAGLIGVVGITPVASLASVAASLAAVPASLAAIAASIALGAAVPSLRRVTAFVTY